MRSAYAEQSEDDNHDRSTRPTPRHDLVELILPLPYQILEIRAGSGPTTPGATPAAAIVLRWHLNVLSRVLEIALSVFGSR